MLSESFLNSRSLPASYWMHLHKALYCTLDQSKYHCLHVHGNYYAVVSLMHHFLVETTTRNTCIKLMHWSVCADADQEQIAWSAQATRGYKLAPSSGGWAGGWGQLPACCPEQLWVVWSSELPGVGEEGEPVPSLPTLVSGPDLHHALCQPEDALSVTCQPRTGTWRRIELQGSRAG